MLEYDNSAFYYFTLSLISIYLLPVTLVLLKQVRCVALTKCCPGVSSSGPAHKEGKGCCYVCLTSCWRGGSCFAYCKNKIICLFTLIYLQSRPLPNTAEGWTVPS